MNPARAISCFFRATRALPPRLGCNLARYQSSLPGHFLFAQIAHDIIGDITYPNEAKFLPVYLATWRVRRQNRRSPAKSRPFPFPHVDDHSLISVADTAEISGSAFA